MAQRFAGKVVWITGGGSGIGRSLALEFAREGADIAVSGRRADRLASVVSEVEALGRRATAIVCDVTSEDDVKRAAGTVAATLGHMDVAVANAGFSVTGRIEKLDAGDWRRQLETNVIGAAMTARYALPLLRKTKGRMVLVGSVAAMLPAPGVGAYCASKYAVRAIGQTLAIELAGTGVSCTTVHPGYVKTEIAQVDNSGRLDPSREDRRPGKLLWSPEDAALAIVGAVHRRQREFVFTAHGKLGAFLGRHMPGLLHFAMSRGTARAAARAEKPG